MELGYEVVQIVFDHVKGFKFVLGFSTFSSVGVCLLESGFDCVLQVFFSLKYSMCYLIDQPFHLFLDPVINKGFSNVEKKSHGSFVRVGHDVRVGVYSLIDFKC